MSLAADFNLVAAMMLDAGICQDRLEIIESAFYLGAHAALQGVVRDPINYETYAAEVETFRDQTLREGEEDAE